MVSFTPETVVKCLATVFVSCQIVGGTIFAEREVGDDVPVAEDRIFKAKKLLGKKKNLLSLFNQASEPQVFHTLSPIEHYPIWKVHKYKGVELRPVQVVDFPTPFDYSAVKNPQYGVPGVDSVRLPHTQYGVPLVDYNSFSGIVKPEVPTGIIAEGNVPFHAPVTSHHHGGKLKSLLGLLTFHKGLLSKLKSIKSWKHGLKQGIPSYSVRLPEVQEIPVGGLENLNFQVPELPTIGLPSHATSVTAGPYVKVQVASPAPVVNYATPQYQPQYAPQYQYQYPPQFSPEYSVPNEFYQPTQAVLRVPAPYYGAPPLFDSYGTPLPADAYSSASSDQVLSFAVPENATQLAERTPEGESEEEYNVDSGDLNVAGSAQKVEELPKFLSEEQEKGEESEKVADQNNSNQQPEINN